MEHTHNYFIWNTDSRGGYAVLDAVQNFENDYLLKRGVSVIADFPNPAIMNMNKDHKGSKKLADAIHSRGGEGVPIVSSKLAEIIKSIVEKDKIELLPVIINNHENKVASEDYVIANAVDVVDCIDREQSILTWNPIDPELISVVEKLVLDQNKIPENAVFFRLKNWLLRIIVREDLFEKLMNANLTGLKLKPVADYNELM